MIGNLTNNLHFQKALSYIIYILKIGIVIAVVILVVVVLVIVIIILTYLEINLSVIQQVKKLGYLP